MNVIIVVLCALLSGAGLYLSVGLGEIWALAWLAPVPVLWLAFRRETGWKVFLAAFAAGAIGGCNILPAYLGTLPPMVLVMVIALPALGFAASVIAAQFVSRRTVPILGVIVFATLWTAFDYLISSGANGTATSPAYSQVGMPFLIQPASIFGLWVVTFLIGFFAASVAMFAATRAASFAFLAAGIIAVNAGYGAWRIGTAAPSPIVHVGLAADDSLIGKGSKADEDSALAVVKTYADTVRQLSQQGASLIVIPEKVAILKPAWRGAAMAELETAAHIGHVTVVIGFDDIGAERRNDALVFFPSGAPPLAYNKRHMVPGLESVYVPGQGSFMLADRTAVAICKDMDFPDTLRQDATLAPTLFAVPAWDFDSDGWWHARLAIMRGVENGFAVARAANDGLLTLTDAYGRVLGRKASAEGGMVVMQGDLPRGPGVTLYARKQS
jgi:apolipoprotein N-acyltransferase